MLLVSQHYIIGFLHLYAIAMTTIIIVLLLALEFFGETPAVQKGKRILYPLIVIFGILLVRSLIAKF